jgi:hypothetical protein
MDNSELKFEDIYNPIVEAKPSKELSTQIPVESTKSFCCDNFCNLIFGCFMFM